MSNQIEMFDTVEGTLEEVDDDDKWPGRKAMLALIVIISVSFLMAFRLIGDTVYGTIILGTVSAYFTANVGQKVFAKPTAAEV